MAGKKGILLDGNNDLKVQNGSLVIGESELQEVGIILSLNQGELKFNPTLGCNLVELIKANASKVDIVKRVRVNLAKDRKDYNAIKNKIKISL
ncbi:hypothetical protein [Flavobacterium beibuense]|uniref:hypothetical protein n=1 Tax=Flavobacterium beibuense TaxID=657326 RepID=UPI003A8D0164